MFHRISLQSIVTVTLIFIGGCQQTSTIDSTSRADGRAALDPPKQSSDAVNADTVVLQVYGMSCPLCSANVDKQLLRIPGVESVNVNLNTGRVLVQVSRDNPPAREKLEKAIVESGFTLVDSPAPN